MPHRTRCLRRGETGGDGRPGVPRWHERSRAGCGSRATNRPPFGQTPVRGDGARRVSRGKPAAAAKAGQAEEGVRGPPLRIDVERRAGAAAGSAGGSGAGWLCLRCRHLNFFKPRCRTRMCFARYVLGGIALECGGHTRVARHLECRESVVHRSCVKTPVRLLLFTAATVVLQAAYNERLVVWEMSGASDSVHSGTILSYPRRILPIRFSREVKCLSIRSGDFHVMSLRRYVASGTTWS